jgi:hypothetical protein
MDAITTYLGYGSYAEWDEDKRINWLVNELQVSHAGVEEVGVPARMSVMHRAGQHYHHQNHYITRPVCCVLPATPRVVAPSSLLTCR